MNEAKNGEMLREKQHLLSCLDIIRKNIQRYESKETSYRQEVKELFQAVKKGDGDSYGQLMAGQHLMEHNRNELRKSRAALKKAYFGRIDYEDLSFGEKEKLYIGKNGVTDENNEPIIIDWRAPVSSVYYENELGEGAYEALHGRQIQVNLHLKRTYDIQEEELLGYFDADVAANDELLVKYLSQNKEAVLGDIIATIQKEQNEIIRDVPYKNVIVQGVAGSGKTTVALHRISYILYNYKETYESSHFCIVGSNDMLLNYISSGLPELDVNDVKQMRMDVFLPYLMGKAWKKTYRVIGDDFAAPVKSKLKFMQRLEDYLEGLRAKTLQMSSVQDEILGEIVSKEDLEEFIQKNRKCSIMQLEKLLNARVRKRVQFFCPDNHDSFWKEKKKQYQRYFNFAKYKWTEITIYAAFLEFLNQEGKFDDTISHIREKKFDIYDAAAMALIWRRILAKEMCVEFRQIMIDEAQDFGESVYYAMRQLLPECCFTIMGDVSQNIRYETGMNDWEGLKKILLQKKADQFYLLSKSYRNTIEISECAGKVLEKASQGSYKIEPVIRHGLPVQQICVQKELLAERLQKVVKEIRQKGFETIAVICRTDEEAEEVKGYLNIEEVKRYLNIEETEESFHNGVMVLPVTLTKGLEFDAVILWKPDEDHYGMNAKEAKLLYVAITRALHELYLIGEKEISRLFL